MPSLELQRLRRIAEALRIQSESTFTFADSDTFTVKPVQPGAPGIQADPDPLAAEIRNVLYSHAYARPFSGKLQASTPASQAPDNEFIAGLRAANRGIEGWEPDWRIYQLGSNGQIFVQKGERCRPAMPGEFMSSDAPGMAARIGSMVSIRIHKESVNLQPGFYFVFGSNLSDNFDDFNLLRFYFNISPEGAAPLLGALSERFNAYQIPFRFKCLNDPALYDRTDAAVLYIARRFFHCGSELVREALNGMQSYFENDVPLFSKPQWPGVGFAEDPGSGESFGMHRCRLLADGLAKAWRQGIGDIDERMAIVQQQFTENGIDLEKAWLNKGSADIFETEELTELQL